jgi:CCR4-NOT transcription complex subunit 1
MESSSNIHTIVKAQIVFLLSTLTEDNFDRNQSEIRSVSNYPNVLQFISHPHQLAEQHGIDVYLHFIRRLIVHSHNRIASNPNPSNADSSSNLSFKLLVQETQRLARDPFLAVRFKEAVDKGEGEAFRSFDLAKFADRTNLQPLERFILSAPILVSASKKELVSQAHAVVQQEFEEAIPAMCHQPAFDNGAELSPSQVVRLLNTLLSDPPLESPVLTLSQIQALLVATGTKYGSETLTPALRQILPHIR